MKSPIRTFLSFVVLIVYSALIFVTVHLAGAPMDSAATGCVVASEVICLAALGFFFIYVP